MGVDSRLDIETAIMGIFRGCFCDLVTVIALVVRASVRVHEGTLLCACSRGHAPPSAASNRCLLRVYEASL
jgi:hypothetical protein